MIKTVSDSVTAYCCGRIFSIINLFLNILLDMMMHQRRLVLFFLYILSTLMLLWGLGYGKSGISVNLLLSGGLFFLSYVFSSSARICLLIQVLSFSILSAYFPTGIIYGYPTAEILGPLLQTNTLEVIGYLKAIKKELAITVVFILINCFIYFLSKKSINKPVGGGIFLFFCFYLLTLFGASVDGVSINSEAPVKNAVHSIKEIQRQRIEQKKYLTDDDQLDVNVIDSSDNTEVRIVIIGESVRRDYMSVYGYPYETTPFLNHVHGIFIDGLVSAAPNTEQSLTRSLFKVYPDKQKIDWGANVISLAKKAGYQTYWISNQGALANGDEIFYSLSTLATKKYFLKKGDFQSGANDDFEMLPILNQIIHKNSNKKVIFIHMIGSHEPVCSRVGSFKPSFDLYSESDCYIASIEKLDKFIQSVTEQLNGKKYKLLYFSDHGLSVDKNSIFHDVDLYQEYQVPLFYLDSKLTTHQVIKKTVSGLNFLDIYADFININSNVTRKGFSFETAANWKEIKNPIIFWKVYKNISDIRKMQSPILEVGNRVSSLGKARKITKNINYSDKCMSVIDQVQQAFPFSSLYSVSGWAATNDGHHPLKGDLVTFIVDGNQIFYVPATPNARNDVREHFGFNENYSNLYGVVGIYDTKQFSNTDKKFYFGYKKSNSEDYVICK